MGVTWARSDISLQAETVTDELTRACRHRRDDGGARAHRAVVRALLLLLHSCSIMAENARASCDDGGARIFFCARHL